MNKAVLLMNCACTLLETNKSIKAYTVNKYIEVRDQLYVCWMSGSSSADLREIPHTWTTWSPVNVGLTSIYDIHGNYWKYYA